MSEDRFLYEYKVIETPRKSGIGHEEVWPSGEGWEVDASSGCVGTIDAGWDRFDAHEELYFRRKIGERRMIKMPWGTEIEAPHQAA